MPWTPQADPATQTTTGGVPDVGYEVLGSNWSYTNWGTHNLYTHFMYKKRAPDAGEDTSYDYWEFFFTRANNDNTWLANYNAPNCDIKYKNGTWSDAGTMTPDSVSLSGTTVTLSSSLGAWGEITSPYPASSGSGNPIIPQGSGSSSTTSKKVFHNFW